MTNNLSALGLSALNSLNTGDQLQLLDVVDTLRAQGLSDFAALPQLIVCGDQSSGKSSVLAALSDLPFPRKDNLCTRFATEVILRRSEKSSISVSIVPGIDRPSAIKERLEQFHYSISHRDDFPKVFTKAHDAMGFASAINAISSDVLRIEITGPSHPQLTIVDLPGLIHSENATQTTQDVELVSRLVRSYMSNSRSIILAVISAKNDFANQAISSRAREFDPEGRRTLGIITKPDTLPRGSQSEAAFISLARNEQIHLELGWHVVKNLDLDSEEMPGASRDSEESHYFNESNFKTLSSWMVGIDNLRQRLSKVLFKQIQIELPGLIKDIHSEMHECQAELAKLGSVRHTIEEQRAFLVDLSQRFQSVCRSATCGAYDQEFFEEGLSKPAQEKRLRAVVRNLEMDFKKALYETGAKWVIVPGKTHAPGQQTRDAAVNHVLHVLKANRGSELPGLPSPRLVGTIFREYSSPWAGLAHQHVREVWNALRKFLERTLQYLTTPDVSDSLFKVWFDSKLNQGLSDAERRLEDLLRVHKREPMTTNHYFSDTAQKLKQKRRSASLEDFLKRQTNTSGYIKASDIPSVVAAMKWETDVDMDRAAAEDALDDMQAYYKTALKLFIDNVPTLVIEVALVEPVVDMFCPSHIIAMKPETVTSIAAENEEKKSVRDSLTRKLAVLIAGATTCQVYAARESILLDDEDGAQTEDSISEVAYSESSSRPSSNWLEKDELEDEIALEDPIDEPKEAIEFEVGPDEPPTEEEAMFIPNPKKDKKKKGKKSGWDDM